MHHRLEALLDDEDEDATDTLELALQASGCDQETVPHKPRLLSDNGTVTTGSILLNCADQIVSIRLCRLKIPQL